MPLYYQVSKYKFSESRLIYFSLFFFPHVSVLTFISMWLYIVINSSLFSLINVSLQVMPPILFVGFFQILWSFCNRTHLLFSDFGYQIYMIHFIPLSFGPYFSHIFHCLVLHIIIHLHIYPFITSIVLSFSSSTSHVLIHLLLTMS